jgi:hypothetical protein
MKMGTKSVLYGAHCFFLHPWFVAAAWWKLYGFPRDPRLWVAFFVHDLGYLGKPNMDGPEGENHVYFGAKVMRWLFDYSPLKGKLLNFLAELLDWQFGATPSTEWVSTDWYCFSFYHSRFMSKRYHVQPSKLCYADKLSVALTPAWLYLPMVHWTGEIHEYMAKAKDGKYTHMSVYDNDVRVWYDNVQQYVRKWAFDHKDGQLDTVTQLT